MFPFVPVYAESFRAQAPAGLCPGIPGAAPSFARETVGGREALGATQYFLYTVIFALSEFQGQIARHAAVAAGDSHARSARTVCRAADPIAHLLGAGPGSPARARKRPGNTPTGLGALILALLDVALGRLHSCTRPRHRQPRAGRGARPRLWGFHEGAACDDGRLHRTCSMQHVRCTSKTSKMFDVGEERTVLDLVGELG